MDTQSSQIDEEAAPQTPGKDALTYEETPPITPIGMSEPDIFPPPKPQNQAASILTTIIFFVILFIVAFWLSGFVRQYAGTLFKGSGQEKPVPTSTPKMITANLTPTLAETTVNARKTYQVMNGKTRGAYDGVSFKLPPEVLAPICDGSTCRSQGTYLPGGTRFTVALRGEGQVLPDFRGKIISDLLGVPLVIKEVVIRGHTGTEFTASFLGITVSGYKFTQMRGYMIPITETISLEINHFSPNGTVSDFVKDDMLFDEIVQTLILPTESLQKGDSTLLPLSSPSATPTSMVNANEVCAKNGTADGMTYSEAFTIANTSTCVKEGKLLTSRTCNPTVGVWWIDMEKTGALCQNVCEIDVVAKTAKYSPNCPD